jgi:hypothetical protein
MEKRPGKKVVLAFLKSRRGGLSGIIFEIILSVVALSLLIMVIYLFRGNMDIIGNSASKADRLAKVTEESLVPLGKNVVKGSDVISVIRFYADEDDVEVEVNMGSGQFVSYKDTGRSFDIADYTSYGCSDIGQFRDFLFDAEYLYEGSRLTGVNYIKK